MASRNTRPDHTPLVVVVGETASGKTALAIQLAKRFNGEIICADSRTVYRGMDIGTAKPTDEERQGIPHYGLDVVDPGESFSAYEFQQLARSTIARIAERGKLPIMVGGTGLYIDAVLYDFTFRKPPMAEAMRRSLHNLTIDELQRKVLQAGYSLPENATNRRHLTRLLESGPPPKQPRTLRPDTVVIGLGLPRDILRERITQRVELMFATGLIDEVRNLLRTYGEPEALKAPGYRAVSAYLKGEIDLAEAKRRFIRNDLDLAKRQRTWFRRNGDIRWLHNGDNLGEAVALVTTLKGA